MSVGCDALIHPAPQKETDTNLLPKQLHAPPRRVRTLLTPIWASLLLLAVITQLGGTWTILSDYYYYTPRFAQLGLISYGRGFVGGAPGVAATETIPPRSVLAGIDGIPVSQ